jgi:hypothetical protein
MVELLWERLSRGSLSFRMRYFTFDFPVTSCSSFVLDNGSAIFKIVSRLEKMFNVVEKDTV